MKVDSRLSESGSQSIAGLPGIVMRNLAADMVEDVGFGDTVGNSGTDPSSDRAKITEEATVESRESTPGESEFRSTVVGEERVGMLEEGNQNEPVVDPTFCIG